MKSIAFAFLLLLPLGVQAVPAVPAAFAAAAAPRAAEPAVPRVEKLSARAYAILGSGGNVELLVGDRYAALATAFPVMDWADYKPLEGFVTWETLFRVASGQGSGRL